MSQLRPYKAYVLELHCIPGTLLYFAARWIMRMLSLARLRSEAWTDEPLIIMSFPLLYVNDASRSVMKHVNRSSPI